jgi:hypothetical protein
VGKVDLADCGTTFADVAMAIVAFAREETVRFCAVSIVLGFATVFLVPLANTKFAEAYAAARKSARNRDKGKSK